MSIDYTPPYPGTPLKKGSSGNNVKTMQYYLDSIKLNLLSTLPFLAVDGSFGSATQSAVIIYQRSKGLSADGIIGKLTWDSITADFVSIPEPARYVYPGAPLSNGDSGMPVSIMQSMLTQISPTYTSIKPLNIDGSFGQNTADSTRLYQKQFSLTADSIIGSKTWNAIVNTDYNVRYSVPDKVSTPYPGSAVSSGSSGDSVRYIQSYMNRIGEYNGAGFPRASVDGVFGAQTKALVLAYQSWAGLKADGIVGSATWSRMVPDYNTAL